MPAGQPGLFVLSVLEAFGLLRADGALLHPASTFQQRQLKGPLARPELPIGGPVCKEKIWILATCALQTWQRPTLPRLETKYHQRWSVSRPSSEWDRVQPLRHNHQVGKAHVAREAVFFRAWHRGFRTQSASATARPSLCEALPGGVGEADCREGKQPSGDNPLDCADDNPLDCAGDGHK